VTEHLKPFLDFYYHQLSIDLSPDHTFLTPSLLWSLLAFDLPNHLKFISRAKKLLFKQDLSKLSFSDLVLLNQVSNNAEIVGKKELTMEQQLLIRQMAYRHDQMEFKANCEDYRKFQGTDTVNEFVQSIKAITYDP